MGRVGHGRGLVTRKNREAALNLRYQEEGLGGGAESRPLFAEAEQRTGHLAIVLAIRNSGKHLLVPPVSGRVWSTHGEGDRERLEGRGLGQHRKCGVILPLVWLPPVTWPWAGPATYL